MSKHTCCGIINGTWRKHVCGKTAKYERDGKWYCGTHDPVSVKEKQKARNDEYIRKANERYANYKAEAQQQAQLKHRSECFPDLLEALSELNGRLLRCASSGASASEAYDSFYQEIANKAISKATGEQPCS